MPSDSELADLTFTNLYERSALDPSGEFTATAWATLRSAIATSPVAAASLGDTSGDPTDGDPGDWDDSTLIELRAAGERPPHTNHRRAWTVLGIAAAIAIAVPVLMINRVHTAEPSGRAPGSVASTSIRPTPGTEPPNSSAPTITPPDPATPAAESATSIGEGPATTLPPDPTQTSIEPTPASTVASPPAGSELTAAEALATWTPPADVSKPAIPNLLATTPLVNGAKPERVEGERTPRPYSTYAQSWITTDGPTRFIDMQSTVGPNDFPLPGAVPPQWTPVEVAPWPNAYAPLTGDGYAGLDLASGSGSVSIWAVGVPLDDLMAIARSLTPRPGGTAGWEVADTRALSGLEPAGDGWLTSYGPERGISWWPAEHGGNAIAQVNVWASSALEQLSNHGAPMTVTIGAVNGHRALVLDYSSDPGFPLASVMWSTTPGLTIEASIRGTVDDALALARSVVEVDRATWESSTDPPYVDPLGHDGCWRSDVFGC